MALNIIWCAAWDPDKGRAGVESYLAVSGSGTLLLRVTYSTTSPRPQPNRNTLIKRPEIVEVKELDTMIEALRAFEGVELEMFYNRDLLGEKKVSLPYPSLAYPPA